MKDLTKKIEEWADKKGLLDNSKKFAQLAKLLEESGELASGILKENKELQKDSIGDVFVVLVILSKQLGFEIEDCVIQAYNEIKDRKGRISEDGSFIREK